MQDVLYFSELVGRTAVGQSGESVGVVSDLIVTSGELFPRVTGLVISPGRSAPRLFLPLSDIADLQRASIQVRPSAPSPQPLHLQDGEARLGHTFLDKQIVDTHGVRVVRINDLKLLSTSTDIRLLGADVGFAGLLRRMRIEWLISQLPGARRFAESVIPWNFVDPLSSDRVRLNVARGRLKEMRPADLADILEQLPAEDRNAALAELTNQQIAETLAETRLDVQREIIERMEEERVSEILEHMAPDDAVDILQDLDAEQRDDILERMEVEDRQEIAELLAYRPDSAGGLMTPDVVTLEEHQTVDQAIETLRHLAPDTETIYYLYIVDPHSRLEGVVSLRSLVTAPGDTPVGQLKSRRLHTVHVDDDQETVSDTIARYNLLALPVVDDAGVLKGIVTIDDVLDVLREEASEDLAQMAGASADDDGAVLSLGRVAWLGLVLLASFMIALLLIRRPTGLSSNLVFLPLLLELAGALGLQVARGVGRHLHMDGSGLPLAALRAEGMPGVLLAILYTLLPLSIALAWPEFRGAAPIIAAGHAAAFLYAVGCGLAIPFLLKRVKDDPTWGLRPILLSSVSMGSVAIYMAVTGPGSL